MQLSYIWIKMTQQQLQHVAQCTSMSYKSLFGEHGFNPSLSIFEISSTWLVVVSGGLSTGIGFAMKDILENIYYGISLMAGRIKIGDYIICDGIRGKVSSINYTSTVIDALDGSTIAFQNSQLFTKNYKKHDQERWL